MNQLINKWIISGISLLLMIACSDDRIGQPPTDSTPPQPIKVVKVESTPGGGIIYYELPDETDISYVKGEYIFQGKKKVVRASIYNNYLTVEGLGSVEPVEVILWMVDHSENLSEPAIARFTPDTPPIETLFSTVELEPDFAGVHITWDNPLGIEIGITLFASNGVGILTEFRTQYTAMKKGSYTFRNFDVTEREFAVKITDKWGNETGMKNAILAPYFEKTLNSLQIQQLVLPYDNDTYYSTGTIFRNLFDNNYTNLYQTKEGVDFPLPLLLTFDLNVTAKLSRFVMYPRSQSQYDYTHHNIRLFELWGAKTVKTGMPNEYWWEDWKQDWVMLGDYEVVKPSGEGPVTNEDHAAAREGFEFSIPIEKQSVRYIRMVMKATWSGGNSMEMAEMSFYGNDGQ